jgi:hypothetical protein
MLSVFARLILTSTALAPVLLTYAWVCWRTGGFMLPMALILACGVLVFFAEYIVRYSVKKFEPISFKVTSVEAADRENFAFLLLYLMPLFTSPLDEVNWEIALPVIIVFGAVVATGYNYHFNPLLGLLGRHFYKVGTPEGVTYVLITRKQLRNASQISSVVLLTEYIVVDEEDQ